CEFVFIRDLSASSTRTFLASLQKQGRERVELPLGKDWFTRAELVKTLSVHPKGVFALIRRHGLKARGKGKARRYPRETVLALQDRLCRGPGTATVNAYLRAIKSFVSWLVADNRTGENPLAYLVAGNARLDPRH